MLKMITAEVPVGLETYYEATDNGQFRLRVEDAVPVSEYESVKSKVKEFRDSNTQLLKEKQKYQDFSQIIGGADLSPEKFNEKLETMAQSRVAALTETMKNSYETRLKDVETNYSAASTRLSELVLGSEVTKVATEHGVLPTALEDVMLRAKSNFTVVDGQLKFKEQRLDAEGKPYSVNSWIVEQKGKAPHLFAPSQGTGSSRPRGSSAVRTALDGVTGVDRIAAAYNNRNSSVKKLNS